MRWLKLALVIAMQICTAQVVHSQSVVWSKMIDFGRVENRYQRIVALDTNQIYVFGLTDKFIIYGNGQSGYNLYPSAFVSRINSRGDTLWNKSLSIPDVPIDAVLAPNGNFKMLSRPYFFRDTSIRRPAISIIEVDTAGNVLNEKTYQVPIPNQVIQGMFQARNGDLIVYGYSTPGTLFANTQCDWLLMCIGVDGRMKWHKVYNPLARFACGCTASEDFDDKILMMGIKDNDLAWQTVDSAGAIVTPPVALNITLPNDNIAQYLWRRFPDGGYFLSATILRNFQVFHCLSKYDANGQQIWNRRVIGVSSTKPLLNTDGSAVITWLNTADLYFKIEKLSPAGSSMWTCNIYRKPSLNNDPSGDIVDATYFPDESAIVCGEITYSPISQKAYLARISNFGNRFSPVSIPENKWPASGASEVPVPYPNPASDAVQFRHLDQPGNLMLYGAQGQLVAQYAIQPGQALSTAGLPSGTYFWRLSAGDKVWSGRLVRE